MIPVDYDPIDKLMDWINYGTMEEFRNWSVSSRRIGKDLLISCHLTWSKLGFPKNLEKLGRTTTEAVEFALEAFYDF